MCTLIAPSSGQKVNYIYHRQLTWLNSIDDKIQKAILNSTTKTLLSNILHSAGMLCIEFLYDEHNQALCSQGNLLRIHENTITETQQRNLLKLFGGFLLCKYFYDESAGNALEHHKVEKDLFDVYDFHREDIHNYHIMKSSFQNNKKEVHYCLLTRMLITNNLPKVSFNNKRFVDLIQFHTHSVYHEILLQM